MGEVERIGFSVSGEFVTDLSRQWLWEENKPYNTVEKLLLSCLVTDQISLEERKQIALEIVEGRKKLVGVNVLTIEEDNEKIRPITEYLSKLQKEHENTLNTLRETEDSLLDKSRDFEETKEKLSQYTPVTDRLDVIRELLSNTNFIDLFSIQSKGITKEMVQEYCELYHLTPVRRDWGNFSMIYFEDENGSMVDSEYLCSIGGAFKVNHITEPEDTEDGMKETKLEPLGWGWLSPTGEFTPSDFGTHEISARQILDDHRWFGEYWKSYEKKAGYLCRDYLSEVKGYVLLHNPSGCPNTIVSVVKPLTKAQREFLYDYFIREGDRIKAESFLE